jgi:pyruvate-ferredoxin/flavodoxin oxidoreductase
MKIQKLSDEEIRGMIDDRLVQEHRGRALTPDRPVMRGTAQNPDVFFQSRERSNPFYLQTPQIVQETMNQFAKVTGRQYHLFDFVGAQDAERVLVLMGSGCEAAEETVEALCAGGEKVGLLKIRLYRPFSVDDLIRALPLSVKTVAVLDRTKEPGSIGEPLYQDVVTALSEVSLNGRSSFVMPRVIGGRYGLSSKEFTPAMCKAVFDELKKEKPKNHFTIGINDDVTHTSIPFDPTFHTEPNDQVRAFILGIGS